MGLTLSLCFPDLGLEGSQGVKAASRPGKNSVCPSPATPMSGTHKRLMHPLRPHLHPQVRAMSPQTPRTEPGSLRPPTGRAASPQTSPVRARSLQSERSFGGWESPEEAGEGGGGGGKGRAPLCGGGQPPGGSGRPLQGEVN